MNEVYKVKETATGAAKIIAKDDQFNPPPVKCMKSNLARCQDL